MPIFAAQLGVPSLCLISRPASTKRALLPTAFVVRSMRLLRTSPKEIFCRVVGLSLVEASAGIWAPHKLLQSEKAPAALLDAGASRNMAGR